MLKKLIAMLVITGFICANAKATTLDELTKALKDCNISGTVGTYFEAKDFKRAPNGTDTDFQWATGYLNLNYSSSQWHNLQLNVGFLAHTELLNRSGNDVDRYSADIEDDGRITLPVFNLMWHISDKSELVIGRWDHRKNTHLDDSHSEGAYLHYGDLERVDFIFGVMRRFAELDYDDGENFGDGGRRHPQDLSREDIYGEDAAHYVIFAEANLNIAPDVFSANPYIYYQENSSQVYGVDMTLQSKTESAAVGVQATYYHVNVDVDFPGIADADCWGIIPFVKLTSGLCAKIGYIEFDGSGKAGDDIARNKPLWFRDYLVDMDQTIMYGAQHCRTMFAKVGYKFNKTWKTHIACARYTFGEDRDGRSTELEFQVTCNLTKEASLNLRFFDVDFTEETGMDDYQKVEFVGKLNF